LEEDAECSTYGGDVEEGDQKAEEAVVESVWGEAKEEKSNRALHESDGPKV